MNLNGLESELGSHPQSAMRGGMCVHLHLGHPHVVLIRPRLQLTTAPRTVLSRPPTPVIQGRSQLVVRRVVHRLVRHCFHTVVAHLRL